MAGVATERKPSSGTRHFSFSRTATPISASGNGSRARSCACDPSTASTEALATPQARG